MDLITRKEIDKLNVDKETIKQELDVDKMMFQRKLLGDLGKEIHESLENPPKRSFITGIKYRAKRRLTIWKENRKLRKLIRDKKKGGF